MLFEFKIFAFFQPIPYYSNQFIWILQQIHLIFRESDHFASSKKASLCLFRILAATTSIFSSSVRSRTGDSSRFINTYLGLLFLKTTAQPFLSAIFATFEKLWFAAVIEIISLVSIFIFPLKFIIATIIATIKYSKMKFRCSY